MLNFYKKNKKTIRAIIFIIGMVFLVLLAYSYKDRIVGYLFIAKMDLLLMSVLVGVLSNFLMAYYFAHLLLKHGLKASIKKGIKVYMFGQIAKYVPGKIWGMVYQISNFDSKIGPAAIILANVELMLNALFVMTIIALLTYLFNVSNFLFLVCLLVGFSTFYAAYKINFLKKFASFLSKFTELLKLPTSEVIYKTNSTFPYVFYFLFIVAYVVSNSLMLNSLFGLSMEETLMIISISTFAWVVSVFVFIVPAGIGVREAIFLSGSFALMPEINIEITASIAIFTRVLQVLQELLGVAAVQLFFKDKSKA